MGLHIVACSIIGIAANVVISYTNNMHHILIVYKSGSRELTNFRNVIVDVKLGVLTLNRGYGRQERIISLSLINELEIVDAI